MVVESLIFLAVGEVLFYDDGPGGDGQFARLDAQGMVGIAYRQAERFP